MCPKPTDYIDDFLTGANPDAPARDPFVESTQSSALPIYITPYWSHGFPIPLHKNGGSMASRKKTENCRIMFNSRVQQGSID